jgi:hypothetical protein
MRLASNRIARRGQQSKDGTIDTVASVSRFGGDRRDPRGGTASSLCLTDASAVRVDTALIASALFLQRFTLHFGGSSLGLDFVAVTLILAHQFASGRLFIQYGRLLWFLLFVVAATCSLLLNSDSKRTSYGLFLVTYSVFTLTRPSTPDQYKSTLQTFQLLVLILSWLAIVQFFAHFIVNPRKLVFFFGIVPESMLIQPGESVEIGVKSNGIFLAEASTMSQIAALGILVEILEFRRPRHLLVLTLAFLLAYSGTGTSMLLLGLPLAALVNPKAQLPAMGATLFALVLIATGFIDLSIFTSRLGEFQDPGASGFMRFTSSFWQAADYFKTASLQELFFGKGPGYGFISAAFYVASSSAWFKLFLEYGALGTFVYISLFIFCFRRSRCPKPLLFVLIYYHFVIGNIIESALLEIIVVLCTLHGPEPRRVRLNEPGEYPSSLVTGSTV